MRHIILCDTEYYSDAGWNERRGEDLPREIIQIGALKLHPETLQILDSFEQLVKTTVHPGLCDYITRLTGISQAMVDADGLPFPDAYRLFTDFMDGGRFVSYGGDWAVFMLTQRLNGMPVDLKPDNLDLRTWFHGVAPQTKGINSGRLAETLGLRPVFKEHTALADCHSIHEALKHLIGQGAPNPFV